MAEKDLAAQGTPEPRKGEALEEKRLRHDLCPSPVPVGDGAPDLAWRMRLRDFSNDAGFVLSYVLCL